MKKLFLTLLITACSVAAFCQVTQEGIGTVDFPESASKMTKDKVKDHIAKKFDNDKILMSGVDDRRSDHYYIVRDVLIYLNFFRLGSGQRIDLEKRKHDDNLFFRSEKDYKSEIRNVGNNAVYITNRITSGNIETYDFLIYKADSTKVITGRLDFQRSNKDAAKTILEHILTHTRFKD